MIRYIKKILDIKNILGMKRGVTPPDPPRNSKELFMHSNDGSFSYTPYFTGDVNVTINEETIRLDESQSGTELTATSSSSVVQSWIVGETYRLNIASGAPVAIVAVNDSLRQLDITTTYLRTLDLRHAVMIEEINNDNLYNTVYRLYAIALNNTQKDICTRLINESIFNNGELWINAEPYAADVIAAAVAKGWTVNGL